VISKMTNNDTRVQVTMNDKNGSVKDVEAQVLVEQGVFQWKGLEWMKSR